MMDYNNLDWQLNMRYTWESGKLASNLGVWSDAKLRKWVALEGRKKQLAAGAFQRWEFTGRGAL